MVVTLQREKYEVELQSFLACGGGAIKQAHKTQLTLELRANINLLAIGKNRDYSGTIWEQNLNQ